MEEVPPKLHTLTIALPSDTPMSITRDEALALFNQLLALLFPPPPLP